MNDRNGNRAARSDSFNYRLSVGAWSFVVTMLNSIFIFIIFSTAPTGVDSGIGPALMLITFAFPVAVLAIVVGLRGVITNRGRVLGIIGAGVPLLTLLSGIITMIS